MNKWKTFENEMTNYINEKLKNFDITIKQLGNNNSTTPDIEITLNTNKKKFYIEVKMPSSQTSQFAVELTNNKFKYSKKNKFKSNLYSEEIIKILNDNFDFYSKVSQHGIIVPVPNEISFSWIVSNMKNKNVKFITSVDSNGNKKIFSLNQFNNFFNIKTVLRRKKSGSQNIPKTLYKDFKKCFDLKFSKYNYSLNIIKKKIIINLPIELKKNDCYIESRALPDGKKYFLSNKGNGKYEVRITSSTNNPNVIFELSLNDKGNFDMFTVQCLIDYINENL